MFESSIFISNKDCRGLGYYSVYGGATSQYPVYGTAASGVLSSAAAAFYPYVNFGEGSGNGGYTASQGYGVQYPHHLFPYSAAATGAGYPAPHYGTPISLAPSPALHSGAPLNGYGVPMHEKLVTLGRYFGVSWVLLLLDSSTMVRAQ
ncbi:hypothetical protein HAX54_048611, partial [Datura stramonium]|nr:hypothetical protein [Datura stramonium]